MKKLWQKNWTLDESVERFETQIDLEFDHYLLKYDVLATFVHGKMLLKMELLSTAEFSQLKQGLKQILNLDSLGKFQLTFGEEDIHTKIENFLTQNYGDVGGKIHTGRSRNDQVLTDLRMLSKSQLLEIWQVTLNCVETFVEFAQQYEWVAMPGYTHLQKAMPSSVGMWAGAFAEGFIDSLAMLKTAFQLQDQSPLGSGAGYGLPLQLDREMTANLLGFAKVQSNSLACQNSRGKIETNTLAALISILLDINKFATDVLLFTSSEFNFFIVDSKICSGSSIMPQKKNVDLAELLRSKVHLVAGNYQQILGINANLPSGYHRDFQDGKKPLIESLLQTKQCCQLTQLLLKSLTPNLAQLTALMTSELFATHYALELVHQKIPFRTAYQQTAAALQKDEVHVPAEYLLRSNHPGGTGNLQLAKLTRLIKKEQVILTKNTTYFNAHLQTLLAEIG